MNMNLKDEQSLPDVLVRRTLADVLHSGLTAWLILGISLAITLVAWHLSATFAEQRAQERFRFQVQDAQFAVRKRLIDYELVLRGGIGLFQASTAVNRSEWHAYVSALQIDTRYPGIQGIGFAKWIAPQDLAAHLDEIRAEGFPDYTLRPPGERPEYTAIVFLEPFDWRNQRAFGFDMYSQATRHAAMSRARDTGDTAMSGKVTLVQETEKDVQHGFLMYLPLYKQDMPVDTVEQRRVAIDGFVYSPFRMRDLMEGILGQGLPEVDFEIFDGTQIGEGSLLYASTGRMVAKGGDHPSTFYASKTLEFGGHTWTIRYNTNAAFDATTSSSQPLMVAFGGVVIDLLLFYIILSLARRRRQALALADERQSRLVEREGQFKAITDSANEGIVSLDADGRITYANSAMEGLFQQKVDALCGRQLVDLLASESRPCISAALCSENDQEVPYEASALRADGEVFPLEISLAKWSVAGREQASAVLRDLTERKRIDRMKSEFISTVSHELRTPLTSIRGSLGLLCGPLGEQLDDTVRNLVNIANNNAERLLRLIDDILDIDKLDSKQMHFDLAEYPLCSLMEKAVEANRAMADEFEVKLTLADCDEASVRVDAGRFQQVMTNLLSNAIKFSPAGEAVLITVARLDTRVRIAVSDKGPGIPEEFRSRIFQKFAQADSSDTRAKGGTGLGLHITKSIVERLGGEIHYTSSADSGCVFYVDLPLAEHVLSAVNGV